MRRFRQHLSLVLFGWLFIQLSALAAPAVLAVAGAGVVEDLCTCAGGDHETCPMHHGHSQNAGQCAMRSLHPPLDVALLSLTGGTGVLPVVSTITHMVTSSRVVSAGVTLPATSVFPDSPPPRS